MKKIVSFFILLLTVGCTQSVPSSSTSNTMTTTNDQPTDDVVMKTGCDLPVQNSELYVYTSADGKTFVDGKNVYSKISVPHIFYDEALANYIVSFQIFDDAPFCDTMAFIRLSSDGEVLTEPALIKRDSDYITGFDPTVLTINDQLALAYTVRPQGLKQPCITVAVGDDLESLEGKDELLWCSPNDDEQFMDPSAVMIDGYLYLYTPSDHAMASSSPKSYYAKVDVTTWDIVATGEVTGLNMFLLGSIIATTDSACPYRFYGTYQGNIQSACTSDGENFVLDQTNVLSGADPGVAQTPTNEYLLVVAQQ